jgi:branched-subunit amino acid ABC-type transport system permease component
VNAGDKDPLAVDNSKQSRDFERLITWSSALSVAVIAALLASLKQVNPSVQFRFSVGTVVGFFGAGALTVLFFRIVLHRVRNQRSKHLLFALAGVSMVLGYFAFGLREVSPEKRSDVMIGSLIAIAVLSLLGWVWWRVVRFLEADDAKNRNPD